MSKVAVITGGTSGIGRETALYLAKNGCTVYELSRRTEGVEGLKHIRADVTDEDSVRRAVEEILQEAGHIDILVNNAGFGISGAVEFTDTEEAQRRAELAVDVQSDIIDAYNDSILGEEREVLCEGYDSQAQMFYGRSYAESPDIDGRIWFTADSEIAPGSFVNVRLTGTMDGETTGELV